MSKELTLKEQAYTAICDAILSAQLQRDRIYSEQWFADNFQMSRTPVREALLQLRTEGIIDVVPNRGVVIHSITMEDARNIFQMRAAIEGYCASNLAKHSGEREAIHILDEIGEKVMSSRTNFDEDDEMFIHVACIAFADNPLITRQFENMRTIIRIFWLDVIAMQNRWEEVYQEHKRIYDAMCAGNEKEAFSASVEHSHITLHRIHERASFEEPKELYVAHSGGLF